MDINSRYNEIKVYAKENGLTLTEAVVKLCNEDEMLSLLKEIRKMQSSLCKTIEEKFGPIEIDDEFKNILNPNKTFSVVKSVNNIKMDSPADSKMNSGISIYNTYFSLNYDEEEDTVSFTTDKSRTGYLKK